MVSFNNTKLHYFCMPCQQVSLGYKVSIWKFKSREVACWKLRADK